MLAVGGVCAGKVGFYCCSYGLFLAHLRLCWHRARHVATASSSAANVVAVGHHELLIYFMLDRYSFSALRSAFALRHPPHHHQHVVHVSSRLAKAKKESNRNR